MVAGTLVLMLHSHLPYYRKAGVWPFGEENLFECMAESYLPLLILLEELITEGVPPNLTLGITPVLAEQLADPYLTKGFVRYLDTQIEKARRDRERFAEHPQLLELAQFYLDWFTLRRSWFVERFDCNLLAAFARLQEQGAIEIVASAATHGLLPLLSRDESIQAQITLGKAVYEKHFRRPPQGFWLPECGYRPSQEVWSEEAGQLVERPGLETLLQSNGFRYTFTEYHALEGASSSSLLKRSGAIACVTNPVQSARRLLAEQGTGQAYRLAKSELAVMGRNNVASTQVWSSSHGYPGDGAYREFYKTDDESGLRYWRLTDKDVSLGEKHLYNPQLANQRALEHASHFVELVAEEALKYQQSGGGHCLITAAFDTELFGHWWFEGIVWLREVLRLMNQHPQVRLQTASQYLDAHPPKQHLNLPECTWGEGGHFWVWNNNQVDWMWQAITDAEQKMLALQERFKANPEVLVQRALKQALRELLLLQSSDWPFLVTTYQAKDYAIQRFEGHRANFWQLASQLESGSISENSLGALEEKNCLFAELDLEQFQKPVLFQEPVLSQ